MGKKGTDSLLENFMNIPSGDNTMFLKEPISIDKIVENLWEDWSIGDQNTPEKIISEKWNHIVGNNFASKCAPDKLDPNGILYLKAANSIVKQELSFKKKRIIYNLKRLQGCRFIKEIKIF